MEKVEQVSTPSKDEVSLKRSSCTYSLDSDSSATLNIKECPLFYTGNPVEAGSLGENKKPLNAKQFEGR